MVLDGAVGVELPPALPPQEGPSPQGGVYSARTSVPAAYDPQSPATLEITSVWLSRAPPLQQTKLGLLCCLSVFLCVPHFLPPHDSWGDTKA